MKSKKDKVREDGLLEMFHLNVEVANQTLLDAKCLKTKGRHSHTINIFIHKLEDEIKRTKKDKTCSLDGDSFTRMIRHKVFLASALWELQRKQLKI